MLDDHIFYLNATFNHIVIKYLVFNSTVSHIVIKYVIWCLTLLSVVSWWRKPDNLYFKDEVSRQTLFDLMHTRV